MNESTNGALRATFDRGALHLALALLNRCVERRNTIPILSNVMLTPVGGGVRIEATNLDQSVSADVAAHDVEGIGPSGKWCGPSLRRGLIAKRNDLPAVTQARGFHV